MCVSRGGGVYASGGLLGDLLPWPIKWGFAFDSVLKETDEPAELHDFLLVCVTSSTPHSQFLANTYSFMSKRLRLNCFPFPCLDFIILS